MKHWPVQSYCTTFAVAAIAMTVYEAAKELFSGGALSAWESHAITITVTASIAVIANVFMRRATTRAVVTERLAIEDELRRINDQLRLSDRILKVAEEGVLVTDANGRIEAINPAFTAITGYSEADVLGKQPSLLKSEHHSPDFFRKMWADLIRDRRWSGEIMNRHKNGEVYILWMTVIAIQENDGRVSHYVSVFRNITEAHEKEARIRYLAFHDALTGLHNRLLFEERLAHAINRSRRERAPLAVLFIDLDGFKAINDAYGHDAGDALLKEVGRRIGTWARRDSDTVARLGGDEFVVLIEDFGDESSLSDLVQSLVEDVARPVIFGERLLQISASIGIALYPRDGTTTDELMRQSDAAMYLAKTTGKNGFRHARDCLGTPSPSGASR